MNGRLETNLVRVVVVLACAGCGPGLKDEPPVPLLYPNTPYEIRCDEPFLPLSQVTELPRCGQSTLTCMDSCNYDYYCIYDCLARDETLPGPYKPMPEHDVSCGDCYYLAYGYCGTKECREQQKSYYCCVAQNSCTYDKPCPACDGQSYAYEGCMRQQAFNCLDQVEIPKCFPGST